MKFVVGTVIAAALALGACTHGLMGEGDECGGSEDKCGTNLQCQPIQGSGKDYCCPTPPQSSNFINCHPH